MKRKGLWQFGIMVLASLVLVFLVGSILNTYGYTTAVQSCVDTEGTMVQDQFGFLGYFWEVGCEY